VTVEEKNEANTRDATGILPVGQGNASTAQLKDKLLPLLSRGLLAPDAEIHGSDVYLHSMWGDESVQ
jgi:hypothetical protein